MAYEQLQVHVENKVGWIKMCRPDIRNAMIPELRRELHTALAQLDQDDQVNVLVLTGDGKAFCAGGDLGGMNRKIDAVTGRKKLLQSHELIRTLLRLEKPVIAAVNGAAAGAGFSVALACDMIVAAKSSFFVQSFVNVGLVPDLGAVHFLTSLLGPHRAKELMFTGERVTADKALELGVVNRVIDDEGFLTEVGAIAEKLAKGPAISMGLTKAMVNRSILSQLHDTFEMEAFAQGLCFETEDFREGVTAFFEKRSPRFSGR
ncbi:enoyl-CoA hydratase/isomerase family protein [Brevibacillus choshinensis]|uniref:Enoyl-CoA hydratase/isomerase family protein n=1 Tax=Brevibacillus choshinensis TaxID=54911 RepID=A0ABX7FUV2_BRECH|nr:enoyl-CoA hydratase-related protein [Brevibacillus choshinensis]QRG70036.1 enoyl-CoA hydratase/isomerase family protein [Brevibacillus choshinensis]